jgi:predicted ATPase
MLKKLKLKNFRCFEDYEIEFDKFNVIVGKNNTGKSTLIDALKLVSNVRRYASYRKNLELEPRDIPFSLTNLRYNYIDTDSTIYSKFSDNTEIEVKFPIDGRPYANLLKDDTSISNKTLIKMYFEDSVGIIPPIGVFEESENLGDEKYIRSILVSHLTPRHFRNIWHYFDEGFEDFKNIIEETWPGYTIEPPEFNSSENKIYMFFKENGITREIFWAGHGFQVWLQLMTFLVKLGRKETLVLDEPDIYLHSDMQKKLVTICKERSNQVIIATHAVDIIEESDPDDIISIDKNSNRSRRLSSIDEVQTCITQLGSFQNLKLVHFIRGKTCLFVEGGEFPYLKMFAKKLNFESFAREDGFSVVELGGFSNWSRLMHIYWIFLNTIDEKIKCYVVLDRDFHTDQEIDEIVNNLEQKDVKVHVWARKEIENYAIDYDTLYRMFTNKFCKRHGDVEIPLSSIDFKEKILSFFEDFKDYVLSQTITNRVETRSDRSIDRSTITSQVLVEFKNNWQDIEFRRKVIPGKDFFAKLNAWLNDEYHITIPVSHVINSLRSEEIEPEVHDVINDFIQLVHS